MALIRRLCLILLGFVSVSHAADKPLWLACGSGDLLKAIEPLAALRRAQGMEVLILPHLPAEALAKSPRRPDFLLVVGDDEAGAKHTATWLVPAQRLPMARWSQKQRPDYATDFAWAGRDTNGIPLTIAGRLPVRTTEETKLVVDKILAWEKRKPSRLDLTMPVWAGDPAYAPKYTEIFMAFFFAQISKNAPPWLEFWMLSGDPVHPLCGWPADQARVYDERASRGSLFSGMIGHGGEDLFCSIKSRGVWSGYRNPDTRALTAGTVRPPHVIFACETGRFDMKNGVRCLAEELLLAPAGPVLSVAATNESHPLPNFYTATNLLRLLRSTDGPARFGRVWMDAQRDTRRRTDLVMEALLKGVEGNYGAAMNPQELKHDHMSLYTIFGDPATTLNAPRKLTVRVEKTATGWLWEATPPTGVPASAKLEVQHRNPNPEFAVRPATADEKTSRDLFAQANAALTFQPLQTTGWRGETKTPGLLRFIVETPDSLYVAGTELK